LDVSSRMSVKIFGSDITDENSANILGGLVCVVYLLGLCLIGWISYQLYYYVTLREGGRGRTFYLIIGAIIGTILMGIDTQIALFIAPRAPPSWPSITSFLGYSFISVFVVCPWLRVVHTLSTPPQNQNQKIKSTLMIGGLLYMVAGFLIFILYTFMADPSAGLKIVGMALFLLGAAFLWVFLFFAVRDIKPQVVPLAFVAGFVVFMLSLYTGFYFVKDIYARGIEFATEIVIINLLSVYSWMILKAHKESFVTPTSTQSQVPLIHDYVVETNGLNV
jgi:MFS family permease